VVYAAEDTVLGGTVALKVLHQPSGNALYRFKNEFRSRSDLKHENLVALYELASDKDRWFFTMELVEGVDIVEYSRGDPERIRDAFLQLARAVSALHDASKVHRDIKPSNVLVDRSRVVLLDFGLVTDATETHSAGEGIVGTPAYMAPEQAFAETVGPACDWYSLGSVLYVALTGQLPTSGKTEIELLTKKQMEDPPRPGAIREGVPPDLDELAVLLLSRDPQKRPSGPEVIARLGRGAGAPSSRGRTTSLAPAGPLVGRGTELATLTEAYRAMRDGRAVVVNVRGRSGFGKTALVRRFVEQLEREDPKLIALTGRCYERESVPYKALDALVDGLRRYIRRLPEIERNSLLPRNLSALTRLFPVLLGVADEKHRRTDQLRDTLEMRRRGFSALHELLARLADRQHLVLFIDDLQWGDYDSAAALAEILAPPDPPPLMLVLASRTEEMERSSLLGGLQNLARGEHLSWFDVELGPLSDDDSRVLVERLYADAAPLGSEPLGGAQTAQIVREAAGMPFMLGELVTFMRQVDDASARASKLASSTPTSLVDSIVRARSALLDPDARMLLEVVCVAGQPLSRVSACRASSLTGERAQASLEALGSAKLVRARGTGNAEELETLHDRVCEAITAGLVPDVLARRHAALAEALEREPGCDPERLGMHLRAAGQGAKARSYLERAAAHASATLAFERAARLYRAALELSGAPERAEPADVVQSLRVKLAEALGNAGHGGEAGRAYLAAVGGAAPEVALDLRRRAAEQFLRSGHLDEALPEVAAVLDEVGLSIPATPARSLGSLLFQRAKLWLRGLDFAERESVPADELRRIDICWTLGNGMGGVDVIRGADFQARHLWLALRAGEPYRISRALAWEAVLSAIEGGSAGLGRAADIGARARVLADRLGNPHALAWATAAEAILDFCRAEWPTAKTKSEACIALFREHCADIGWEVGSMEMWWWLPAARWLGDYPVLTRRAAACAREASARGDLYTVVGVRTHVLPHVHLIADRPDEAMAEANEAIRAWSSDRWLTHHWCNALVQGHAALYAERFDDAIVGIERDWRSAERALQSRLQTMRVQLTDVRARIYAAAALAQAKDSSQRLALAQKAERDAKALERETLGWASALGIAVRAAVAKARGDEAGARIFYARAAAAFVDLGMAAHASAARLQVASLEGGDNGAKESAAALKSLRDRGVVRPKRLAAMLVP
jgi:hypothetical protein